MIHLIQNRSPLTRGNKAAQKHYRSVMFNCRQGVFFCLSADLYFGITCPHILPQRLKFVWACLSTDQSSLGILSLGSGVHLNLRSLSPSRFGVRRMLRAEAITPGQPSAQTYTWCFSALLTNLQHVL